MQWKPLAKDFAEFLEAVAGENLISQQFRRLCMFEYAGDISDV